MQSYSSRGHRFPRDIQALSVFQVCVLNLLKLWTFLRLTSHLCVICHSWRTCKRKKRHTHCVFSGCWHTHKETQTYSRIRTDTLKHELNPSQSQTLNLTTWSSPAFECEFINGNEPEPRDRPHDTDLHLSQRCCFVSCSHFKLPDL